MPRSSKRKTKVYLVEDQELVKEYVSETLKSIPELEYIGSATSAEDALNDLEELEVELVIMDIGLPGMNGIQATRLLKQRHPQVTVMMLTGEEGYMGEALEVGALGYVTKLASPKTLLESINDILLLAKQQPV